MKGIILGLLSLRLLTAAAAEQDQYTCSTNADGHPQRLEDERAVPWFAVSPEGAENIVPMPEGAAR
jgi:hypothetical protein